MNTIRISHTHTKHVHLHVQPLIEVENLSHVPHLIFEESKHLVKKTFIYDFYKVITGPVE